MEFQLYYKSGVVRRVLGMKFDNFNVWVRKNYISPTERGKSFLWDFDSIVFAYAVRQLVMQFKVPPGVASKIVNGTLKNTSKLKITINTDEISDEVVRLIKEI